MSTMPQITSTSIDGGLAVTLAVPSEGLLGFRISAVARPDGVTVSIPWKPANDNGENNAAGTIEVDGGHREISTEVSYCTTDGARVSLNVGEFTWSLQVERDGDGDWVVYLPHTSALSEEPVYFQPDGLDEQIEIYNGIAYLVAADSATV